MLPSGRGVSNEEAGGLRPSKKADPRISLFADALSNFRPVDYAVRTGSTSLVRTQEKSMLIKRARIESVANTQCEIEALLPPPERPLARL